MKAFLRKLLPEQFDRLTAYVVARHTMLVGSVPLDSLAQWKTAQACGAFYYVLPRAYVHMRALGLGLIVPLLFAFLGAEVWPVLGIWWSYVVLAAIQLGGTVREVIVHGWGVLPKRLVWHPVRMLAGAFVPVTVTWGPFLGAGAALVWVVGYLLLLRWMD